MYFLVILLIQIRFDTFPKEIEGLIVIIWVVIIEH